jgi:hypothetical protein
MAVSPQLRLVTLHRQKGADKLFGTVVRRADRVLLVRVNASCDMRQDEQFFVEMSGPEGLVFIARLLDDARPRKVEPEEGRELRFQIMTDLIPL